MSAVLWPLTTVAESAAGKAVIVEFNELGGGGGEAGGGEAGGGGGDAGVHAPQARGAAIMRPDAPRGPRWPPTLSHVSM